MFCCPCQRERNLFIQNLNNSISIIFTPRPREMSSHRPVSRFRQVLPVKKPAARDPRFGERSGKYNPTMFKKAYGFIDEMKEKEKKMAEKELRKTKNPERKSQLHKLLQKMVCCAKPMSCCAGLPRLLTRLKLQAIFILAMTSYSISHCCSCPCGTLRVQPYMCSGMCLHLSELPWEY